LCFPNSAGQPVGWLGGRHFEARMSGGVAGVMAANQASPSSPAVSSPDAAGVSAASGGMQTQAKARIILVSGLLQFVVGK